MGNDGGDIPGRKELVRDRKKVELPSYESIAMGRYCCGDVGRASAI